MRARNQAAILVLLIAACCGASQREKTLNTAAVVLRTASGAFEAFDASYQAKLVNASVSSEEGKQALAAYRLKRAPVVRAFTLAFEALGLAIVLDSDDSVTTKAIAAALAAKTVWDSFKKDNP